MYMKLSVAYRNLILCYLCIVPTSIYTSKICIPDKKHLYQQVRSMLRDPCLNEFRSGD